MDRLDTFLAATEPASQVSLRALTLHMLEALAPKLFATRGLAQLQRLSLERCATVGYEFEEPHRLEAGVDAWYCRHLKGLPHPPPDPELLRAALQSLAGDGELIYAWLIGEQAARCGLDVRVTTARRPFRHLAQTHDGYWLTHLVMLDTDYFTRPLRNPEASEWAEGLEELVPWLLTTDNDDLLGEFALCLRFMKRDASALLPRLERAAPTQDAHAQATALLALSVE